MKIDINNLNSILLDTDEKTNKFFNALKLHDTFEQMYIFRKITRIKINKDAVLRTPLYYPFALYMNKYLNPLNEIGHYLSLMDTAGFSIEDQRDFIESNELFIVQLDPDVANTCKDPIVTFRTKSEAEEFIKEWKQLDAVEKIVKFLKCPKTQYSNKDHDHYEVVCREFILINDGLKNDPIQTIKRMILENIPNDEIQTYYMMHQICK